MSTALVLAGGGAKGAFQIGCWKAFRELGMDNFDAIIGTSVGGLNTALIAQGDLNKALELWENITRKDVFKWPLKRIMNYLSIARFSNISAFMIALGDLYKKGFFITDPLVETIKKNINFDKIRNSPIKLYVTASKFAPFSNDSNLFHLPVHIQLNGLSDDDITKALIATSAIPLLFPREKLSNHDDYLVDGGVADNLPWRKMLEEKYDKIYMIPLSDGNIGINYFDDLNNYGGILLPITPNKKLGRFLNFNSKNSKELIKLGYEITKEVLSKSKNVCFDQ